MMFRGVLGVSFLWKTRTAERTKKKKDYKKQIQCPGYRKTKPPKQRGAGEKAFSVRYLSGTWWLGFYKMDLNLKKLGEINGSTTVRGAKIIVKICL